MPFFPATLAQLRADVRRWAQDQPLQDSITAPVAATTLPTSVAVNDVSQWPVGALVEADTELMFVTANPGGSGAGSVTVSRGWEGTVAAAHSVGVITLRDPRYLTANINEALNVVVHDWASYAFPQLVWDTATGGQFNPLRWIIPAPSDALSVERVVYSLPGFQRYMDIPHSGLRMYPPGDLTGGQTFSASGVLGFEIFTQGMPGFTIKVLYGKRWPYLFVDTDTVPIDFPEEGQDLVVEGAVLYLAGWRMTPKFSNSEVIWNRESNAPIPTNANLQLDEQAHLRWTQRMQQVRARRPTNQWKKIWVGHSG